MFLKSIRWRLQLWLAFLLVCVLSGFGVTVYQLQRITQLNQLDEELSRRVAAVSSAVRGPGPGRPPPGGPPGRHDFEDGPKGPPPPPRGRPDGPPPGDPRGGPREMRGAPKEMWPGPREIRLSSEVATLFDETRTNSFYFAAWSSEGGLLKRSTNAPTEMPIPTRTSNDTRTHTRMRGAHREAFHFTERGDCILAGRSMAADLDALRRLAGWLTAAGGAVLAFGLGGGCWLAGRAIRPLEAISVTASRISAGNLSERINVAGTDNELGRLAGTLNATFARLEAVFAQQKQFTADASHELRTPIAVLISEAQAALARERTASEYRETVEACLATAQEMRRLAESLLELSRFDAGQEPMKHEPFDLAETVRHGVELVRPLASQRGIQIHCDLAPAMAYGDALRIQQVITNLLTNAIHYNQDAGEIRVTTRAENGAAQVTVTDCGLGIGATDLPHIFKRFYRVDKSRARAEGRNGLGLAICKAIVDAHGGGIEVSSKPGAGSTFSVRLPA